jgi:hypothetical protein
VSSISLISFAFVALVATGLPTRAIGDTIPEPVALLQGLDKITARVSKFEAPVGAPVRFGTLSIRVRDCEKNPPEEAPESAAFVEIDKRAAACGRRDCSAGGCSPQAGAVRAQHAVYDVNLLDCKAANETPREGSGSAAGKDAR